jgi:hypothetical protein
METTVIYNDKSLFGEDEKLSVDEFLKQLKNTNENAASIATNTGTFSNELLSSIWNELTTEERKHLLICNFC